MNETLRTFGFFLGLTGGPFAATAGYLLTLRILTRAGWFTTGESNRIEILSVAFEVPVFESKWHSVFLHALSVFGMVFVFVLYVKVIGLIFSVQVGRSLIA